MPGYLEGNSTSQITSPSSGVFNTIIPRVESRTNASRIGMTGNLKKQEKRSLQPVKGLRMTGSFNTTRKQRADQDHNVM